MSQTTKELIALGNTNRSDRLHTENKGILGQISRVGQGVLLPQLAKNGLKTAHGAKVDDIVALKEEVDASAQDEPEHRQKL